MAVAGAMSIPYQADLKDAKYGKENECTIK
jgi:hypothetical protein